MAPYQRGCSVSVLFCADLIFYIVAHETWQTDNDTTEPNIHVHVLPTVHLT